MPPRERRSLPGEGNIASDSSVPSVRGSAPRTPRRDEATRAGCDVSEMSEKRGANDDPGGVWRRLRAGRGMPPELMLLLTAFVWGGYHPCMRMLLTDTTEHGSAPTPSEINLARFSLVAVLFVAQAACADAACSGRRGRRRGGGDGATLPTLTARRGDAFGSVQSLVSAEEGAGREKESTRRASSLDERMSASTSARVPVSSSALLGRGVLLWGAAFELAFWHFVTIAFQSTGVAYTGATRAGFIAASTTMMVPFVSAFFGEAVRANVWIAACVAMAGAALIVFATTANDVVEDRSIRRVEEEDGSSVFFGDALTLVGSVTWAVFVFRLSRLAPRFPKLPLATARSACMTLFVAAWFLVDTSSRSSAAPSRSRWRLDEASPPREHWLASPRALALTAFMAIGPGWACGWWQTVAQAKVSAPRAAVLTSTTPLWGAAWAFATMGETMSWVGWVGGLTIVGGTALVALER